MQVIFPVKVYQKLKAYVTNTKYEISGLGKIKRVGDDMVIEDLRIFKQTVTGQETKLDKEELGRFYDEIIQQEGDLSAWKLWWHSHADMDAFFSATDNATIEDFDNEMDEDNWMMSIVTNQAGQIKIRIDIFKPVYAIMENVPWKVDFDDLPMKLAALRDISEFVTTPENKEHKIDFTHLFDKNGKLLIKPEDIPGEENEN